MPTWYSIRNRLESGDVKGTNRFERFLTSFVTSYGCLDLWFRDVGQGSSQREVRVFYIQKDPTFTKANSWERNTERPEFWLQFKGSEDVIRASMISLLPHISQLHDKKRHGEWNLGATQPFDGQGSITTVQSDGTVVVSGRFGDIGAYNDGAEINWDDITWAFDGCSPTATLPVVDTICFRNIGTPVFSCRPTVNPVGTCLTGSCTDGWEASYPITQADCTSSDWFENQDLSKQTQAYWNNYKSCPAPTGTCVSGDCTNGFVIATNVAESSCIAPATFYEGEDYSGTTQDFWRTVFNCADPKGCCIKGTPCQWGFIGRSTASECAAIGGTFTEGLVGEECTREYQEDVNNCLPVPSTVTFTVTFNYTTGSIGAGYNHTFSVFPSFTVPSNYVLTAVTPGQQKDLGVQPNWDSNGNFPCGALTSFTNLAANTSSQNYGTLTKTFTFNYVSGDDDTAVYEIDEETTWPSIIYNPVVTNYIRLKDTDPACGVAWEFTQQGYNFITYPNNTLSSKPGRLHGTIVRYGKDNASTNGFARYTTQNFGIRFTPQDTTITEFTALGIDSNGGDGSWNGVPFVFNGRAWFKAEYGDTPPSGFNYVPFEGEELFGAITIDLTDETSDDRLYGDNATDQVVGVGNKYNISAFRFQSSVSESGTATKVP